MVLCRTGFSLLMQEKILIILLLIKIKIALQQKVFNMKLLVYITVRLHAYALGEALVPFKSASPGLCVFLKLLRCVLNISATQKKKS